ncbi:Aste57867_8217 [Aphanomyces stellatus]|uniref:Aste57867_8217 protein n=1 Tax=Aphanomyces stellatus TaxID=120398 RepID=A0A485KJP2_9STRA|nr:hypothetical protein As57867_008186 [Aphanomyces stellatus]VFT85104.1 Aste57867_8217 [Aphanomyces stellatus]
MDRRPVELNVTELQYISRQPSDPGSDAASDSIDSESGFSFLQSPENAQDDANVSWSTKCCRVYTPMRMCAVAMLVLAAVAAAILLGVNVQKMIGSEFSRLFSDIKGKFNFTNTTNTTANVPTNATASGSWPPLAPTSTAKSWPNGQWTNVDLLVFSLPNSCRVLSILGVTGVILCYLLKPTFRFNSMPLIMPMLLSQLGFLTSRFYISVSNLVDTLAGISKLNVTSPSVPKTPPMCKIPSDYCGLPSSILSTTFNLCQIAFTVAITYHLLQSVGSPVESLCDARQLNRRMRRWVLVIILSAAAVATTISLASVPTNYGGCQYNPWICTSPETQLLNNMIAPAVGLATVTFFYFRIKAKIQVLYPANARRTFKSVATYHIVVFVVTWGISLFLFSLLTVLHKLPDWDMKSAYSAPNQDPSKASDGFQKLKNMLLTFVPYDLQGFFTSVVAVWSYFRLRTRFDLGLSLKAINPAAIEFDEPLAILGQGAFAVVVKATWFPSRQQESIEIGCFKPPRAATVLDYDKGLPVAVKTFKLERNSYSHLNGIQEEAYLASKLIHPNIMATYGCYTVGSTLYLVCEYLGGGTLQDVIDAASPLPYEQVLLYALQIASGMEFLHGLDVPVIHRDLKPLNCCFDQAHAVLKLVDFGFSRLFRADPHSPKASSIASTDPETTGRTNAHVFSSTTTRFSPTIMEAPSEECVSLLMTSRVGTVCWAAPEVLAEEEQTRYSLKVDVYSFAIICWQLYTGKQPYSDIPGSVLAVEEAVLAGTRPKIPDHCPVLLAKLMRRAWHAKPDRRPSFADIVRVLNAELNQFHMYGTVRCEPHSPLDLD